MAAEKAVQEARRANNWSIGATFLSAISLVAVAIALRLTIISNQIARDTARRQLRAYVAIKKVFCSQFEIGKPLIIDLEFVNLGQTPASNVGIVYMVGFRLDESAVGFDEAIESDVISRSNWGTGISHGVQIVDNEPINLRQSSHCIEGGGSIYAWGACYYTDIFGDKHKVEYRYAMGGKFALPGVRDLVACDSGNTTT